MRLKTNVKIDFNDGLFDRKKDFFEAKIEKYGVLDFKHITLDGYYYYTNKGEESFLRPFTANISKSDFEAYLAKLSPSGVASMEVIENIMYFSLKEHMAKEFGIDVSTINIIGSVVVK